MFKRKIQPIVFFLGLSLFAHFVFVLSAWLPTLISPQSDATLEKVEISYIDPSILKNQQIVEQQRQINDEKDEKAKFLSAFDQKVLEQTKADATGQFQNSAGGGTKSKEMKKVEKGEIPSLEKLVPSFKSKKISDFEGEGELNAQRSQTDDHLKEVKSGLQTLLSTREFVYYSYYARIKDQIRQHWGPKVKEKVKIIYKQGRNIASAHDRVTQVLVILDKSGSLMKVEVLSASGVVDLDAAAIEAFEAAAPFPNPPEGMIETDGTIKIRWDFILEA